MKSLCPADTPPVDIIITFFIFLNFSILLCSCLILSFKIPRYINLKFSFSLNDFIYSGIELMTLSLIFTLSIISLPVQNKIIVGF